MLKNLVETNENGGEIDFAYKTSRLELTKRLFENYDTKRGLPIIVCIGSDGVAGDSLGPLAGKLLVEKYDVPTCVYGTLNFPITAKRVELVAKFVERNHRGNPIIAIDAGIGQPGTLGDIHVRKDGIFPGLAVGKVLPKVGTHSIVGIVGDTSFVAETVLYHTRLSLVYEMADVIAGALSDFLVVAFGI